MGRVGTESQLVVTETQGIDRIIKTLSGDPERHRVPAHNRLVPGSSPGGPTILPQVLETSSTLGNAEDSL